VLYAISASHFVRRNFQGEVLVDTRDLKPPFVLPPIQWSEGTPEHTLENPGPADLVVIGVELKDQTTDYRAY